MSPIFCLRIKQAVHIQNAGIGLVVLGWIRVIDFVRGMHLLDKGPPRIRGVAAIVDERQERPETAPFADEALVVVGAELGRHPRNADAIRVVVV